MARGSYNVNKRYDHYLLKASKVLPDVVDNIVNLSVNDGREVSFQLCAKDTTRLSKTVRIEKIRSGYYKLRAGQMEGFDGVYVDYEIYVEMEQPFLHPGMQVAKQNLLMRMRSLKKFLGE